MNQDTQNHGPRSRPQRAMFDQQAAGREKQQATRGVPRIPETPRSVHRAAPGAGSGPAQATPPPRRTTGGNVHTSERTKQRRQRQKRRRRRAIIISCSCIALVAVGLVSLYYWVVSQLYDDNAGEGSIPDQVKTEQLPEYNGKGIICGLVCGIDYDDINSYTDDSNKIGNTDLILYMMYDTVNAKVNFLQIPRDTYVGEDADTGGTGAINGLYPHAADKNNRMAALATVINDQLGLPIDFYITLDMDAVKAMVDHRGSIYVYVPRNVEYTSQTGETGVLLEGWRHLTSAETEFFLRNRNYGDADLTRLQMQQSFYSALFREFKELSPYDLLVWMKILLHYVNVEGLSVGDLGGLAQKALTLDSAGITFVRPPVAGARRNGKDLVSLVPEETASILNEYFRPDGHVLSVDELNIQSLPVFEAYGVSPASVRTMSGIQDEEPAQPPGG